MTKIVYDGIVEWMASSGLYRVNADGRIETCRRWNGHQDVEVPWYVCDRADGRGYLYVSHRMARVKAHRLAYCLHHPNTKLFGREVNHIHVERGTKDNREDNLELCDAKRQSDHAYETGLNWHVGEKHRLARLTDAKVKDIRDEHRAGSTCVAIAARYGVTPVAIQMVVRRKTWKHVT